MHRREPLDRFSGCIFRFLSVNSFCKLFHVKVSPKLFSTLPGTNDRHISRKWRNVVEGSLWSPVLHDWSRAKIRLVLWLSVIAKFAISKNCLPCDYLQPRLSRHRGCPWLHREHSHRSVHVWVRTRYAEARLESENANFWCDSRPCFNKKFLYKNVRK
jgi:hypothetical protein